MTAKTTTPKHPMNPQRSRSHWAKQYVAQTERCKVLAHNLQAMNKGCKEIANERDKYRKWLMDAEANYYKASDDLEEMRISRNQWRFSLCLIGFTCAAIFGAINFFI